MHESSSTQAGGEGSPGMNEKDLTVTDAKGRTYKIVTSRDIEIAVYAKADFYKKDLAHADLYGTSLEGARFGSTNLDGVSLSHADLSGANLTGASLTGANFVAAILDGVQIADCDALLPIKKDVFDVLSKAPGEALGVLKALREGRIDGSVYQGPCACLVGTIAKLQDRTNAWAVPDLTPDAGRPAEAWFTSLKEGDTPANSPFAKITEKWILEFLQKNSSTPA